MFKRLLIANRGEIACRVIRTARQLGIRCIAVWSDADEDALHVEMADEAYRIGPAPARESYLDIGAILGAAERAGAGAVHPGYGFLSENADFAEACAARGIVFVGPPVGAIRAMGSKSEAKRLMSGAGVPLVPGYHGADQSPERLRREAEAIGWPVLLKASAGGGGRGMRAVERAEDFDAALAGAKREAAAAFGDDAMLIERYVAQSRHVEVQVFADRHGNFVHLFERDCSAQRRHQKVIEEAPAPGVGGELRAAMCEAAIAAARAIGYEGAGTVEFLLDRGGEFWFMEMNTRLQVEHPVTEMVTGTDLVEWQLRIAAGEPLPVGQADLSIAGHAVEARVYAEDPERGFLPSTGTLAHMSAPPESRHVRIDRGVREGDAVTPHYDPMIAKVIAHGEDRATALDRLAGALEQFAIAGVVTNLPFLSRLVADAEFRAGRVDTGLIDRNLDALLERGPVPDPVLALAAMHAAGALSEPVRRDARGDPSGDTSTGWRDPWSTSTGWRLWGAAVQTVHLRIDGDPVEARVTFSEAGGCRVDVENASLVARLLRRDGTRITLDLSDRIVSARLVPDGDRLHVVHDGRAYSVDVPDRIAEDDEAGGATLDVVAPLPGRIVKTAVQRGDAVRRGATLMVLEAMKMELAVEAPRDGIIGDVTVSEGDQVVEGAVLVTFADADADSAPGGGEDERVGAGRPAGARE